MERKATSLPLPRPRQHLIAAGKQYPNAWRIAGGFLAARGKEVPDWPGWCYLPLSAWYAIVAEALGKPKLDVFSGGLIGPLGALGAWRLTQGIYRFDPALYEAVIATPGDGDLPHDVLYCLPEWCVYIETPGMAFQGEQLYGFFAHLEHDVKTGRPELRLLLDIDSALTPMPIHLGPWSLSEGVDRMCGEARAQAAASGMHTPSGSSEEALACVTPLISLLLYLCSQNAEIGDGSRFPANPAGVHTKKGVRFFPPDNPTTWDVGVRLGAALRRAYHAEEIGDGTHAGPRPHIRRAHWHHFRRGPRKDQAGNAIETDLRPLVLKWLPPIPVNLDDIDALPSTIKNVL